MWSWCGHNSDVPVLCTQTFGQAPKVQKGEKAINYNLTLTNKTLWTSTISSADFHQSSRGCSKFIRFRSSCTALIFFIEPRIFSGIVHNLNWWVKFRNKRVRTAHNHLNLSQFLLSQHTEYFSIVEIIKSLEIAGKFQQFLYWFFCSKVNNLQSVEKILVITLRNVASALWQPANAMNLDFSD